MLFCLNEHALLWVFRFTAVFSIGCVCLITSGMKQGRGSSLRPGCERRKLLPLSRTSLSLFQLITTVARKEMRRRRMRQRQTDNPCTDVFSFSDWCVWDCRIDFLGGVSSPPHPPHSHHHHQLPRGADWSESWLSGRVGTPQAARHCCLHSAASRVSLHATLLTLSSAVEGTQRASWKNQLVATTLEWMCIYTGGSNEPMHLMYSGQVPHPNCASWIGSL